MGFHLQHLLPLGNHYKEEKVKGTGGGLGSSCYGFVDQVA